MNSYLLDTHTLLWALFEPEKLGMQAYAILTDRDNPVYVSSVSFWEISLKAALGKLTLTHCTPDELPDAAENVGFSALPLEPAEAATFYRLPRQPHKDPFDRMLIWQALRRNLILVSRDRLFSDYAELGLKSVW